MPQKRIPKEKEEKIIELLRKGRSIREIANRVGVSTTTVVQVKKRNNITNDNISNEGNKMTGKNDIAKSINDIDIPTPKIVDDNNIGSETINTNKPDENIDESSSTIEESPVAVVEQEEQEEQYADDNLGDDEDDETGIPISEAWNLIKGPDLSNEESIEPPMENLGAILPSGLFRKKKAIIIYYSETGRTASAAEKISEVLSKNWFDVTMYQIKPLDEPYGFIGDTLGSLYLRMRNIPIISELAQRLPVIGGPISLAEKELSAKIQIDCSGYDLVVIGSPVWCNYPATPVIGRLQHIKGLKDKPVGVFVTCWMSGAPAVKIISNMVSQKGGRVVLTTAIDSLELELTTKEFTKARSFAKNLAIRVLRIKKKRPEKPINHRPIIPRRKKVLIKK